MRLIAASFILVGAAALGSLAAPAVSKKGAPPRAAAKSGVKRGTGKPAAANKRTVGKRIVRRRVSDHYSYVGQQRPAPERIQEIERALAGKGYLAGEPDVNWDQASMDALRRFQQSQNLYADGRLSSMSLIALGLGSRQNGVVPAPAAVAPDTARPGSATESPADAVPALVPPPPPPSSAPLPLPVSLPPRVPPAPAPPLTFTPTVAARPATPKVVAPPPAEPIVNKPALPPAPAKNMPLVTPDTSVPAN